MYATDDAGMSALDRKQKVACAACKRVGRKDCRGENSTEETERAESAKGDATVCTTANETTKKGIRTFDVPLRNYLGGQPRRELGRELD
jgi:hypothetical protein